MAIIHSLKIMMFSLVLYSIICGAALLPSLICYKIPPSNVKSPPILNTYRQRFDFVLKTANSTSSNSTRIPTLAQTAANCPWKWGINNDTNRFPRMIAYAKCDKCDKACKPVKFHHKVLYSKCDFKTGEMAWTWKGLKLNVGYVYVKPSPV